MQSSDGSPARPTNAAPLVPVRLNADGNFRIAPPYVADPAFTAKPDVPKGRVIRFTMNSAESKLFPTAPAGAAADRARARRTGCRDLQSRRNIRRFSVRSRSTFLPDTCPIPHRPSSSCRTNGGSSRKTHQPPPMASREPICPFMPVMLDNLIHEKRIPPIVAVLLSPGPGGQRTIEYDTVSDRYVNFVETEVLPRITRDYQVAFTTDPEGRAAFGESSGAAAALTMAWLHPNLYRRVISYSGTFVALQRNATAPNGAWDFHQTFIPNSERKPLRIWLHVSENDLGATSPVEQMRNWVVANNRMAAALKAKGYPYQFVFSEASGHVERSVEMQTMPEAFEWVWKGYKPAGR